MTRFRKIAATVAALSLSALPVGAKDEGSTRSHWALRPLVAPPVPSGAKHPVDAFVNAELAKRGLSAAPEAERHLLIRRVYFDLIGLPPPPEAIQRFVEDRAPDAYERLVDTLLASPRYGERWARHWIDAAHFAETHGHDQDRIRPNAWPYRDYLIASLNSDKPYARFVEEQVAGDALFPDDPQATVALGFLAAGPWDESSLRDIREDTIDRQIGRYLDRDDVVSTVMSTFTSATVHCARCHDHKFDPISQEDYYALQAVFAGVERANRLFDRDPGIHRKRRELLAEKRALDKRTPALMASTTSGVVAERVTEWERRLKSDLVRWKPLQPLEAHSAHGATLTVQQDASVLSSGTLPDKDVYTLRAAAPLGMITAIRLEVLPDDSLPQKGPGRRENGNLHLSEFELYTGDSNAAEARRRIDLRNATADFNQADWIITQALDGNEQTAWGIHPKVGEAHQAIFELREAFYPKGSAPLIVALKQLHGRGHLIGRLRVSVTDAPLPVRVNVFPEKIRTILDHPADRRTAGQQQELALYWMQIDVERRLSELPPPELIYAAASDFAPDGAHVPPKEPRTVHLLKRGDIRKPGEVARPGALSCVSSSPARFAIPADADESARRVALARWLSDSNNPLTWRSIVNRIWHHHFGRGVVDTPNDFGKMGSAPSHPELLDWLSIWFRDGGGTLKRLHHLMVTSAAYRRASTHSASNAAVDADNRFLWRMNRQRLDAECVRDAILLMTGRLDLRMGGPSDQQFELKPGHHVTPLVNYNKFNVDSEGGRRRSIYRFLFRTLPDPFMDALDCPSGDQLTGKRNVSVTVQQAFALWNSAFTTRHAEHLAEHLKTRAPELKGQITIGCQLAWSRPPTDEEATEMMRFGSAHGLANLCRVILNSNEFLFVD